MLDPDEEAARKMAWLVNIFSEMKLWKDMAYE